MAGCRPGSAGHGERLPEAVFGRSAAHGKQATRGCPCGYFGDPQHNCVCGPLGVAGYLARVSGPLLDRIDIHLEVPAVKYRALADQILKIARTIADLEGAADLQPKHVSEAIQYRSLDRRGLAC